MDNDIIPLNQLPDDIIPVSQLPEEQVGTFGKVPLTAYRSGERNIVGNIFERPGAAIRSVLTGKGYTRGAVNPSNVPSFQNLALEKFVPRTRSTTLNFIGGLPFSTTGLAADIATNPADLLTLMIGKTPTGGGMDLGTRLGTTKAGQAISRFGKLPIEETAPGKVIKSAIETPEKIGKGTVRALIPYESVTERGLSKGFKPMLKPEYYQERIPQDIMKEGTNFFNTARENTGKEIKDIITQKYSDVYVDAKLIQDEARSILGKGIKISDLDISPAQKKLLMRETEKVLGIKGKKFGESITEKEIIQTFRKEKPISISNLWDMRKGLDKVMYDSKLSWKPDALKYLRALRNSLNNPIKSAGEDISNAFGKYTNIENVFDEIGGNFEAIVNPVTKEISSPKFSNFLERVIMADNPKSIELRNMMSQINPDLAEKLFDVASARNLGKSIKDPLQGGFFQATMYPIKRVLHPKNVATAASKFQDFNSYVNRFNPMRAK